MRASLDMYRKILDAIEENDYDNFRKVGGGGYQLDGRGVADDAS